MTPRASACLEPPLGPQFSPRGEIKGKLQSVDFRLIPTDPSKVTASVGTDFVSERTHPNPSVRNLCTQVPGKSGVSCV